MKLYVTYEIEEMDCKPDFDWEETAAVVGEAVLKEEGFPGEAEVSLVLTSEEEIHRINQQFRGIDAPTDVLSFPAIPFDSPSDFQELQNEETAYKNPDTGNIILGDIMISVPRVFRQADAYGHSVRREFSFLIAHSILHLLGYDHIEPDEAKVMEEKQEQILKGLGIHR